MGLAGALGYQNPTFLDNDSGGNDFEVVHIR